LAVSFRVGAAKLFRSELLNLLGQQITSYLHPNTLMAGPRPDAEY
jgi:hypothetical protein